MSRSAGPVFSVVIPVYNQPEELSVALDSLKLQTYAHWEAIVVDDRSDDNASPDPNAYSDERIKIVKKVNNSGRSAARNTGIDHSNGDYICFLDCDDLLLPDHLLAIALKVGEIGGSAEIIRTRVIKKTEDKEKFERKTRPNIFYTTIRLFTVFAFLLNC